MVGGEYGLRLEELISSYRDLRVWQEAMDIATRCYASTQSFPRDELFGLTSQIRRAAVTVPANIAEGHGRESTQSFIQFLRISQGSLKELETHLILAVRVGVAAEDGLAPALDQCDRLGRMLHTLIRSLQRRVSC